MDDVTAALVSEFWAPVIAAWALAACAIIMTDFFTDVAGSR